jgi:propanol-preferring alcohol dehydrogenase
VKSLLAGQGSREGASETMRAVRLTAWERPAQICRVPRLAPGPGEVLLRVDAAGLCHSDLHLMRWPTGSLPYELPFTLGHEVAGTVLELGPGATGFDVSESVIVYGPWGCGVCRWCSRGSEHLCERRAMTPGGGCGLGRDGGLAEELIVPSPRLLVPLGDLDPVAAAPLADAGLTPYHAIRRALALLVPGSSAVVIGVGGLGHVAVQLLRALSPARIVVVDTREDALELGLSCGADVSVAAEDATPAALRRAAGGPIALVLDCVGVDATLRLAGEAVSPGGHLSMIGMGGGALSMRLGSVPMETPVVISNWGTRVELAAVVALAAAGAVEVEVERVALDEVPAAYERLGAGGVRGRLVAVPGETGP